MRPIFQYAVATWVRAIHDIAEMCKIKTNIEEDDPVEVLDKIEDQLNVFGANLEELFDLDRDVVSDDVWEDAWSRITALQDTNRVVVHLCRDRMPDIDVDGLIRCTIRVRHILEQLSI